MPKEGSTEFYYEVRTKGDGEFAYFAPPPQEGEYGEENYDPESFESARAYADEIGGYVVLVRTRVIHVGSKRTKR